MSIGRKPQIDTRLQPPCEAERRLLYGRLQLSQLVEDLRGLRLGKRRGRVACREERLEGGITREPLASAGRTAELTSVR